MTKKKIIAIDIGATKIHVGIVQDGAITAERKVPTSAQGSQAQVLNEIVQGVAQLMDDEVAGIGIGVPGLVDDTTGVVYDLNNVPSWQEVPLGKHLEDHFQVPVYLGNDANMFVLGEKMYGQAKDFKNVVGITLGTGLGAGIIIDNNLYTGTLSSAGEFGCIPYLDKNIEAYCSGSFFTSKYGLDGNTVKQRAEQGDKEALEIFRTYGEHLGNALHLVLYTLSPEAIFLGGSVSRSFHLFEEAMQARLQAFPFKRVTARLVVAPSSIDNAALLGAAALFQMKQTAQAFASQP
ncbi:ROK family protein [Pontibacter liquoris]|uniref:ROK family protein n=1 Tax=Pontibacter liquoris TaxID=2905677 RepID=UPI001FA75E06|nr:ROK family protein [Pontibacter liquoris]